VLCRRLFAAWRRASWASWERKGSQGEWGESWVCARVLSAPIGAPFVSSVCQLRLRGKELPQSPLSLQLPQSPQYPRSLQSPQSRAQTPQSCAQPRATCHVLHSSFGLPRSHTILWPTHLLATLHVRYSRSDRTLQNQPSQCSQLYPNLAQIAFSEAPSVFPS
jgi:hypothetical protein